MDINNNNNIWKELFVHCIFLPYTLWRNKAPGNLCRLLAHFCPYLPLFYIPCHTDATSTYLCTALLHPHWFSSTQAGTLPWPRCLALCSHQSCSLVCHHTDCVVGWASRVLLPNKCSNIVSISNIFLAAKAETNKL